MTALAGLFSLTGKTAIVTGSSCGIGKAIVEAFAAQGANVVISSRNQDSCDGGATVTIGGNLSPPTFALVTGRGYGPC